MGFKKLFSAKDVTSGTPWKSIVALALPLLIGNIVQTLYNTVDTIVVGKYVGDNALSAVGASAPVINVIMLLFVGISTGATILVSQRYGAHDREGLSKVIGNCVTLTIISVFVTMAIGLFLINVPVFGGKDILELLNTPEGTIYEWCKQYLTVIFVGVAGNIFYNMFSGILRGLGDSVSSLVFLILSCGLNIVLDLWFVASFGLGVFGVALATVLAQAISAVACGFKIFRMKNIFSVGRSEFRLDKKISSRILALGLPSGISSGIFSMSNLLVQSLTNSMGAMVMASNVVVGRIDGFAMMPNFSLGNAMTTYCGQNYGAKKYDRLEKGSRQSMIIAVGTSLTLTCTMLLFARPLAGIFTETGDIIDIAILLIKILAPGYIAMGFSQVLQGYLRGTGDTKTPMWITVITQVVLRIPLAYFLAAKTKTAQFPNGHPSALYTSLVITIVTGAVCSFFVYLRRRKLVKATFGTEDASAAD